ncbi:DUF4229 domain-containing protein [Cryobacterium frigoriphilum]|uniref:DUF4229 domain-containing protein n=1 Tax=Cryobacterium frigoriphilum TaxID=1259150 RepID=A0A4R8ZUL3_9MICO|nr:DUF4229 domain-containing protein [Cryobacterium frigoriphilum]TFD46563.1 DUF4229 domain-containing protein [Cryobacterium frigoriphilum]
MKTVPVWVYYSVLRVLLFVIPLVVLLALRLEPWLAALLAAIIGLCVSYLLLRRPREGLARDLYEARHRDKPLVNVDAETEDAAIQRAEAAELAAKTEPVVRHDGPTPPHL